MHPNQKLCVTHFTAAGAQNPHCLRGVPVVAITTFPLGAAFLA